MKTEYYFIGRCRAKGCSVTIRVTIPARITNHTRNTNWYPGSNLRPIYEAFQKSEPAFFPSNFGFHCLTHKCELGYKEINGRLSPEHVCDSRCTGAKGPNCDCSCGGANHGKAYSV